MAKRNRKQTEQAILDAAAALVGEEGPPGVRVNVLAARCGYDKVLIYRYFGAIDGVLAALAEREQLLPGDEAVLAGLRREADCVQASVAELAREMDRALDAHPLARRLCATTSFQQDPLTRYFARSRDDLLRKLEAALTGDSEQARAAIRLAWALAAQENGRAEEALRPLAEQLPELEFRAPATVSREGAGILAHGEEDLPTHLL